MTTKVVMGQLSTIVPKQSGSAKQIVYKLTLELTLDLIINGTIEDEMLLCLNLF
jgi:hypothetical protein